MRKKPAALTQRPTDSNVVDITEILGRAIESERARHGADRDAPAPAAKAARKTAAPRTSARKTASTKKSTAKKQAPAKKTAAKRTAPRKAS